MLTAAVRDLHRTYPGRFLTSVETRFPDLWKHNPYVTSFPQDERFVREIDCHYPLIQRSNFVPKHFLDGYIEDLNRKLNLAIELTEFRGDVHLSEQELSSPSPVADLAKYEGRYWIIVSGGKRDFTIKWWDAHRYQEIVDHFRGSIQFVQVGAAGDFHPELDGVIDLRAQTNLRDLIRLVYHADGIVCPVTSLMHLAAAVPSKPAHRLRPCVVIAGGREPAYWESYPGHQYLHTIGMLPCCRAGGCWRARTRALPDKSHFNLPQHLCVDVVGNLPRCMDMIRASDVIRRIEMFLEGEADFKRFFEEERRRMDATHLPNQMELSQSSELYQSAASPQSEKDLIIQHYRDSIKSKKARLIEDLSERALTNTPRGLGDTVLITQLPWIAHRQGKLRYITSESSFFAPLMRFNPYYKPSLYRPTIPANVLQFKYDLGNGHLIQRLQRAFGLEPDLLPRGYIETTCRPNRRRVVLHFEAGAPHAAWQRMYVHPRARQLYPESRHIIQRFIDDHPEMRFAQIGGTPLPFRNVEDRTNLPLEETIGVLSEAEYFLGIISGPMHLATALGIKCIVLLNFPDAAQIFLPTLKDVDLIESEWLYPQNVHLHQESDGPLVKQLTLQNLERAIAGEIYPYWSHNYLSLIHEAF